MEKITSRRNSQCLHVKRLGAEKDYRYENFEFLCDGIKLLEEALKSNVRIKSILTAKNLDLEIPYDVKLYLVGQDILNSISPLKNPQDVLFICEMPSISGLSTDYGTHVLLDSMQDPGNVGTIIRSADAFGIHSVMLYGSCADPFNPKTVRASMGSVFRQQVCMADSSDLSESKLPVIGASADFKSTHISEVNFKDKIIAIGNEGKGLSKEILELCAQTFRIPISNTCESLNAAIAASIIMWEAKTTHNQNT